MFSIFSSNFLSLFFLILFAIALIVAAAPAVIDEDFLIAERARELMWEGHRRTDLVRYGKYTSKDFPWPYKGGSVQGNVDLGDHMNIFPIPSTEMASNLDLIQNPGYAGR